MVATGELDTKQANAIIYACNAILSAIRTEEDEQKRKELESLLMETNEMIERHTKGSI